MARPSCSVQSIDPKRLGIVFYPDPVLLRRAQPVEAVTDQVRAVALRMIELMHEARGVGLAAPQVGLSWRLFVANPTGQSGNDRVMINPVLHNPSRETIGHEEGCLSVPGVTGQITRSSTITVEAIDLAGQHYRLTSDELPACVWQHEMDHLNGVLIMDRMAPIDRMANRRTLQDLERNYAPVTTPTVMRNL